MAPRHGRSRNQNSPEATDLHEDPSGEHDFVREDVRVAKRPDAADARRDVPRWRQIEIMRERRQLRQMLEDFGEEDLNFEEEVFGSTEEAERFFRNGEVDEAEVEATPEEGFTEEFEEE